MITQECMSMVEEVPALIDTCPFPRAAAEIGSVVECELSTKTLKRWSAVAGACPFCPRSMHEGKPRAAVKHSISSSLEADGAALPRQAVRGMRPSPPAKAGCEGHASEPACERGRLYHQRARRGREVPARVLLCSLDPDVSSPLLSVHTAEAAQHI